MPTIKYCPFCEQHHKFHIEYYEDTHIFELRCIYSGLLVEEVQEELQFDRFSELKRQFIPPPE